MFRIGKEWLFLTGISVLIWEICSIPIGFYFRLSGDQWVSWFTMGTIYDLLMMYPASRAIIYLNTMAKKRGWY